MAKQKKKRNKVYRGQDASIERPTVTRISAANRNRLQQWWLDRKQVVKPVATVALIALIVIWLIFELVRAVS